MLSRREFIKAAVITSIAADAYASDVLPQGHPTLSEARYYDRLDDGSAACRLCPRGCVIPEGGSGFCRARKNIKGTLYTLGYASPCAVHVDPVEKKPLFHYLPGTYAFSLASAGCSLRCKFCQNWQISQVSPLETQNYHMPPERVPSLAKKERCRTIAYTYSEPTSFYEYMHDIAKAARKAGLMNVYHSNGFTNSGPLGELYRYMDAANIDMKGFSDDYYKGMSEAWLSPVLETLKTARRSGVWLEITNLTVPGYNDDPKTVREMAQWIKSNLGPDTPLHFSRFFPLYKLTGVPPTPVETLERSRDIAMKSGLNYVYIGNIPGHPGEHTYCPKCKKPIIKRSGFVILENNIKDGRCGFCREKIAGVWSPRT